MPHVIVKLWPGKSGVQKARLAEAILKTFQTSCTTERSPCR